MEIPCIVNKPQFNIDELRPGTVLYVEVKESSHTQFPRDYKEYVIVYKVLPFELEVVDKTTYVKSIHINNVLDGHIVFNIVKQEV